jgi:hypothetical protein
MTEDPASMEPLTDVSWSRRATELYIQGDKATAMAEIGPERMELYHNAIMAGVGNPDVPRPGHPWWEFFLSYLQAEMEKQLGSPLDEPLRRDTGTTVTMTESYQGEDFHPWT